MVEIKKQQHAFSFRVTSSCLLYRDFFLELLMLVHQSRLGGSARHVTRFRDMTKCPNYELSHQNYHWLLDILNGHVILALLRKGFCTFLAHFAEMTNQIAI